MTTFACWPYSPENLVDFSPVSKIDSSFLRLYQINRKPQTNEADDRGRDNNIRQQGVLNDSRYLTKFSDKFVIAAASLQTMFTGSASTAAASAALVNIASATVAVSVASLLGTFKKAGSQSKESAVSTLREERSFLKTTTAEEPLLRKSRCSDGRRRGGRGSITTTTTRISSAAHAAYHYAHHHHPAVPTDLLPTRQLATTTVVRMHEARLEEVFVNIIDEQTITNRLKSGSRWLITLMRCPRSHLFARELGKFWTKKIDYYRQLMEIAKAGQELNRCGSRCSCITDLL